MHPMPARRSSLLVLALLCGSAVHGAEPGEAPYLEPLPQVLSASRLLQAQQDAPGAITVIDRELILASGYRDLPRILRLVPGMEVGQERGNSFWVTYHGMGNSNPSEMQVLIDGNSVYSPSSFGGVDWNALPLTLDEIDRIEVVRGANASTYGANALLAVINIITRHSADEPGFQGRLRQGSRGVTDQSVTWGIRDGPLSLRLSANLQHDLGFAGLNDSRQSNLITLRSDYQLTPTDALMLRAGASRGQEGQGYPASTFGYNAERTATHHDETLHLQWRHAGEEGSEWLFNYYHNQEDFNDAWLASAPPLFPAVPLDRKRTSSRDHLDMQHRLQLGTAWQAVWGAEVQTDEVHAPFLFASGNPPTQTLYRLFTNAEWRARPDLTVNLGGSAEKFSRSDVHFSPRVFANWQASPRNTFRAGYAQAYRAVNQFELFGDIRAVDPATGSLLVRPFLSNPDLRQTRMVSTELGYLGRFDTGASTVDVRLFNERLHDFVVRVPAQSDPVPLLESSLGSSRYANLGDPITLRGVEYQIVTHPRPGTELLLTHTLIDADAPQPDLETLTAPYMASLTWRQEWPLQIRSMLTVRRMGPLAGGDGFVPRSQFVADAYTTLDAHVDWRTLIGGTPVQFGLTGVNLGSRHQEVPDRSIQAQSPNRALNPTSPTVYLTVTVKM
jgi:iron complex outermembrane receptor protein